METRLEDGGFRRSSEEFPSCQEHGDRCREWMLVLRDPMDHCDCQCDWDGDSEDLPRSLPYFTIAISLLQVMVDMVEGKGERVEKMIHSPLVFNPERKVEVWRFLTYMLLHYSSMHLLLNVLVQLILGVSLEVVHGSIITAIVYLIGVLAGSIGMSIFDPEKYLLGSSAGIYALLTCHVADIVMVSREFMQRVIQIVTVSTMICADVGIMMYEEMKTSKVTLPHHIGWAAHASGALAGFLLGMAILHTKDTYCILVFRLLTTLMLLLAMFAACITIELLLLNQL